MADGPLASHELVRVLTERARELGWEMEWDWKDTYGEDEGGSEDGARYEVWIWHEEAEHG